MIRINIFKILFSLVVAIIIFNFYFFVKEFSLNQYSDWLINYQGGFVRRGFIGEIFYQVHSLIFIRLDFLVFFSVSLFYIFFYKNLLSIIQNLKINFINLLIIFSPISFVYPVMEEKASGRKDVLFLLLLSITALYLKKINFYKQKYFIIIFSAILIFSHTGFLFLLPSFLVIFLFSNKNQNFKVMLIEIFFILLCYLFFLILILANTTITPENIQLICDSISEYVRTDCSESGYISTLDWSLKYNLNLKENLWMTQNYNIFYIFAFFFSFFPLLIAFYYSKFLNYKKINVLLFFTIFLILTLPLYYLGVDYGRYMHLTYMSLVIMFCVALQNRVISSSFTKNILIKNLKIRSSITILIIFIYGFTFTIPHCCNNELKFNYSKMISKINLRLN